MSVGSVPCATSGLAFRSLAPHKTRAQWLCYVLGQVRLAGIPTRMWPLGTSVLEGGDRRMYGAHWADFLAKSASFRFSERPCLKREDKERLKKITSVFLWQHTHEHTTHVCSQTDRQTHKHT